jgi:hypothetical protein
MSRSSSWLAILAVVTALASTTCSSQPAEVAETTEDAPPAGERVYREDLETFPANGWSLFGLQQSLAAQGRWVEAAAVGDEFAAAWQYADVTLKSSRF